MVHMNSRAQKKKPKMWCRLLAGIITLLYLGIVVSIVIMHFAPREWKVINASQGHFIGLNNSMPPLLWLCVGFFALIGKRWLETACMFTMAGASYIHFTDHQFVINNQLVFATIFYILSGVCLLLGAFLVYRWALIFVSCRRVMPSRSGG